MKRRGILKIYFGYSSGVGKTYGMLRDAHRKMRMGVDVVVGYIEPHSGLETRELLEGLEVLPAKIVANRKSTCYELNLTGALLRKPQILLVDGLAHVNAPGLKHEKRYQDIEELLTEGIDVYTTINAHHIASLAGVVAGILQPPKEEIISDFIFDWAERVQLVDVDPEVVIERFREGKIFDHGAKYAVSQQIFMKKNLDKLRELSFQKTTDRLNQVCNWS